MSWIVKSESFMSHFYSWLLANSHPFLESKAAAAETSEPASTNPPTTPEPTELPHNLPTTGRLSIQVTAARDLSLPSNVKLPPAIEAMVDSELAQVAASVTASSVSSQRAKPGHKPRDSVQREQSWWLPYVILEFDVNEVSNPSLIYYICSRICTGAY
jgi:serum/glucocorticoid-regulated kinase 2